jgi:hypothetical protein
VLTLCDDPVLEELWSGDLQIVGVAPASASLDAASRQLDIVLDRIAQQAADVTMFMLDDTYDSLLVDDHDRQLKEELNALLATLDPRRPIDEQILDLLAPLRGRSS